MNLQSNLLDNGTAIFNALPENFQKELKAFEPLDYGDIEINDNSLLKQLELNLKDFIAKNTRKENYEKRCSSFSPRGKKKKNKTKKKKKNKTKKKKKNKKKSFKHLVQVLIGKTHPWSRLVMTSPLHGEDRAFDSRRVYSIII